MVRRSENEHRGGRLNLRQRFFTAQLVIGSLALLLGSAGSATGDHVSAVKVIDATQLKGWIDEGHKVLLIDSRVVSEYEAGHLPTAINIPANTMERARGRFPANLEHIVVFYCNGWPQCKKSHDAAALAAGWGYRQIYWFRDGLPAWQAKHYPIE